MSAGLSRKQVTSRIYPDYFPKEDPTMQYIGEYHWLHIKTGATGVSQYQGESLHALLVFLNRCNSQSAGQWQYWY